MAAAIERIPTAPPPTLEELRTISAFSDLTEDQLSWLAGRMTAVDMESGEVALHEGAPAEHLFVLLKGELRAEREDGRVYIARAGQVTGLLPYSRLTHFPSTIRASAPTRVAALSKDLFPEMLQRIPVLAGRLVNLLSDRIRESTKVDQQREKLMALGKLSAGLAHELNNPASAARRAADNLRKALQSVRGAALELDRRGLPAASRLFLAQLECDWEKETGPRSALDTLERSEREEEFAEWLENHHVRQPWNFATALVDLGCTKETLDRVAKEIPADFLTEVLTRMTAAFTMSRLVDEIESSTSRMSELVRAIKEYSYMDQMPAQEIDIHDGIENTLIMLHHRLKKGVDVVREYDRSIPKVFVRGSELNQIWTNLISNSIDAMNGSGKLLIRTSRDGKCARVEVIDNGPGIPVELQSRIFEPFFTTKPVGEGTGLGLETVYRIAKNHGGDVTFASRPGETAFTVRLPFGDYLSGR